MDIAEIPSWPIVTGDDIATFAEPAMVKFDDGSRLLIDRASSIRLEKRGNRLTAVVLSGSVDFILSDKSELQVFANDDLVTPSGLRSGTASASGRPTKRAKDGEERIKNWKGTRAPEKSRRSVSPYEPE